MTKLTPTSPESKRILADARRSDGFPQGPQRGHPGRSSRTPQSPAHRIPRHRRGRPRAVPGPTGWMPTELRKTAQENAQNGADTPEALSPTLEPQTSPEPKDGEGLKSIRNGFEAAVKRAGIEKHIRFHDLRHTFASWLVMKGIDLRTVAKLVGHRDIRITMRYAHLAPEHLQAAVDALVLRRLPGTLRQGTDS